MTYYSHKQLQCILVLIRVFIIDYVMHGRPIFFVLPGTITFIYDYDYDYDWIDFCPPVVVRSQKGESISMCSTSVYFNNQYTTKTSLLLFVFFCLLLVV